MSPSELFPQTARDEARRLIEWALREDLGPGWPEGGGDLTSHSVVPATATGQARFVSRESGVLCGIQVCPLVLEQAAPGVQLAGLVEDGQAVEPGQPLAVLSGPARQILLAERTCLNFLGRLSGISSLTRKFVEQIQGTRARLFDTRKTTPGWRNLEKYAVACGGGHNHRMGLFDAVLIKDNHLALMDALTDPPLAELPDSVAAARHWIDEHAGNLPAGRNTTVQVEVDTLEQLAAVLPAGPDIVLLDNMGPDELETAVGLRDREQPQVQLEASGGVNLQSIGMIARTGVDRISVGALTHSAVNFDIGLDWQPA